MHSDVRRVNHLAAVAPSECAQLWTLSTQTLVHVAAYLSICLRMDPNTSTNTEQRDLLQRCADTLLKALCTHDDDGRQLLSPSFQTLSATFADASRRSINDTVYDENDNDEEPANGARRRRQAPPAPPTNVDTLTQVQLGVLMVLEEASNGSTLLLACTSSARHVCHHAHMTNVDISFQPLLDAVLRTLRAANASTDTCDDPRSEQFECAPLVRMLFSYGTKKPTKVGLVARRFCAPNSALGTRLYEQLMERVKNKEENDECTIHTLGAMVQFVLILKTHGKLRESA